MLYKLRAYAVSAHHSSVVGQALMLAARFTFEIDHGMQKECCKNVNLSSCGRKRRPLQGIHPKKSAHVLVSTELRATGMHLLSRDKKEGSE